MIGKVGFGRDFGASRDIDNTVNNTFRLVTNDFEENMRRAVFPLRKYSRSQVALFDLPDQKLAGFSSQRVRVHDSHATGHKLTIGRCGKPYKNP